MDLILIVGFLLAIILASFVIATLSENPVQIVKKRVPSEANLPGQTSKVKLVANGGHLTQGGHRLGSRDGQKV